MSARGQFSSRIGFILAAAGSAVGLGNIWGFPTKVAENGGAAFVLMYLIMAFLLAYPVLMAELIIGRAKRANMIDALRQISGNVFGTITGSIGAITVILILSFYAIVAGWMLSYLIDSVTNIVSIDLPWLTEDSIPRNLVFMLGFLVVTCIVVNGGVSNGIERWSVRLMPTLLILITMLIIYVSTLDGAAEGWSKFLVPDFSKVFDTGLMIDAMGQAFFSMSLGVGTMLVYGSYIQKHENLPRLGTSVALVDIGVAVLAGMLIIPAMYVALANGVQILDDSNNLISGPSLIFQVLPSLFESMGYIGTIVAAAFFALMAIAALTSSISMLEVPVAFLVDNKGLKRSKATLLITALVFVLSALIVLNFEQLFGLVITATTEYSQPLLGLVLCVFAGWIWRRDQILEELKNGCEDIKTGLFWKIWPWYVKFVCPLVIALMFYRSVF
ncbi:sodium-dependent transporter [Glaciecola petra]|uniref:Sodium-dependent transporter n=1 Tax=Glaciecola petra TaxID=3075602 RepID=A0ABU2ZS03_9ALTE|nr:sodium-dependent transporter [Aestuariibacter sp. P117]MDT0594217.1 sodium-dependent transporter [Aestuariibacter sp. P117]